MPAGYTTVAATKLRDASGTLITNATATFTPNYPFRVGADHGQTVDSPITVAVTNGAFSVTLADTSISTPQNVSYRLVVRDNLTGEALLADGYDQLQPSGDGWSLDDFVVPIDGPLAVIVPGPQGPPGNDGVFSLVQQAATRLRLPAVSKNLYNKATDAPNSYVRWSDGTTQPDGQYGLIATDFIPANSGGQMVFSHAIVHGYGGIAMYDANYEFVSTGQNDQGLSAGTVLNIPAGVAWVRFTWQDSASRDVGMVCNGSVLPGSYVPFDTLPAFTASVQAATDAANTATAGQAALVTGQAAITAGAKNIAAIAAAKARLDLLTLLSGTAAVNLFDLLARTTGLLRLSDGAITVYSGFYVSDFVPIVGGQPYTMAYNNGGGATGTNFGLLFYAADGTIVSGLPNPFPQPYTFVAPANSVALRFTGNEEFTSQQMIVQGSSVPAYVSYPAPLSGPVQFSSWVGKKMGFFSDSLFALNNGYCVRQVCARLGAQLAMYDLRGGRKAAYMLDVYTQPTASGVAQNFSSNPVDAQPTVTNVTAGQLLGDVLAPLDAVVMEFGANDADPNNWGSYSDTASSNTLAGQVRLNIERLMAINRKLRIIQVTPYAIRYAPNYYPNGGERQQAEILRSVCDDYGVPLISMIECGMSPVVGGSPGNGANADNSPLFNTNYQDFHPNQAGYDQRIVPYLVRMLNLYGQG